MSIAMQTTHAEFFRKAIMAGSLPDSLLHPLRSVEVNPNFALSDCHVLNYFAISVWEIVTINRNIQHSTNEQLLKPQVRGAIGRRL